MQNNLSPNFLFIYLYLFLFMYLIKTNRKLGQRLCCISAFILKAFARNEYCVRYKQNPCYGNALICTLDTNINLQPSSCHYWSLQTSKLIIILLARLSGPRKNNPQNIFHHVPHKIQLVTSGIRNQPRVLALICMTRLSFQIVSYR